MILSSPCLFYFLRSVNGSFIENTCEAGKTSRQIKYLFPISRLTLSYCWSNVIKQEGRHFLPLAHMDVQYQYTCTLLAPAFLSSHFFLPLTHSLSYPLVFVRFFLSVRARVQRTKEEKVTKFARALSFPL